MSFKIMPTTQLAHIAACGGGFTLDAAARPSTELAHIAACGAGKGARLVFRGMASRPPTELAHIAACGKGCVAFED